MRTLNRPDKDSLKVYLPTDKQNKILFCQFNTKFLYKDDKKDISSLYYEEIWQTKENEGYYKSEDFWEIPLWIAEVCGALPNSYIKKLYIIKNNQDMINLNNQKADFILFSVLDINKSYIFDIIKNYKGPAKFILGGYIDFTEFRKLNNVIILDSIKDLANYLGERYIYNLDYTLFSGLKTIPRLTLSLGCYNHCKFCSVPKKIKEKTMQDIIKQVKSFSKLNFRLIYLNDKTFGQSKNYKNLKIIYTIIKKYNPNFKGFIIQTTAKQCLNLDFINSLKDLHIFAIELGIETYNNDILKNLLKPQDIQTINEAMKNIQTLDIKIIGNFIIGLIGENKQTYNNTLKFIEDRLKNFYFLNIYNLAIYKNTELAKEVKTTSKNDKKENTLNKSFYSRKQNINNQYFYNQIFKLGLQILGGQK